MLIISLDWRIRFLNMNKCSTFPCEIPVNQSQILSFCLFVCYSTVKFVKWKNCMKLTAYEGRSKKSKAQRERIAWKCLMWQHTRTYETREINSDFCLNFCAGETHKKWKVYDNSKDGENGRLSRRKLSAKEWHDTPKILWGHGTDTSWGFPLPMQLWRSGLRNSIGAGIAQKLTLNQVIQKPQTSRKSFVPFTVWLWMTDVVLSSR